MRAAPIRSLLPVSLRLQDEEEFRFRVQGFKPLLGLATPAAVPPDLAAYLRTHCGVDLVPGPKDHHQVFMQVLPF